MILKKIESELPMWVIAMTHLYHALKLYIWNPNDSDFCVGGRWNLKNFYIIWIQIKFAIDWYVYFWYCSSRTRDIEDVLKKEHHALL